MMEQRVEEDPVISLENVEIEDSFTTSKFGRDITASLLACFLVLPHLTFYISFPFQAMTSVHGLCLLGI